MIRSERVLVLVWSLPDAVLLPGSDRDSRGLMPTRREACQACEGSGSILDRFSRRVTCGGCDGLGRFWVDGYTGDRVGAPGSTLPLELAAGRRVRVGCSWCQSGDRGRWDEVRGTWVSFARPVESLPQGSGVRGTSRCDACEGTGWRWLTADEPDPSGAKTKGADTTAWRIRGSYHEVAGALEQLLALSRPHWRALTREATRGTGVDKLNEEAGFGLSIVTDMMPSRVEVAGDILVAWRAREERSLMVAGSRDHRIRVLISRGKSPTEVGKLVGLSERRVREIAYTGR